MNGHALPDDPARWPDDPYQVLGVAPGVSPGDLRAAYGRLAGRYVPERFPEHARRLREAYDDLRRYIEIFFGEEKEPAPAGDGPGAGLQAHARDSFPAGPLPDAADRAPPSGEVPPAPQAAAGRAPGSAPRPAPLPAPPPLADDRFPSFLALDDPPAAPPGEEAVPELLPVPDLEEELKDLWEAAASGQPSAAYARLAELTRRHAGRTDLYLRLYWLLTTAPDLDGSRDPADWLVEGMLASGLAAPLRGLYRRLIAADPEEAVSPRFGRLLEAPAPADALADLAQARLQAALKDERWDRLADGMHALGERLRREDETLWLGLLLSLADSLAWHTEGPPERLFQDCAAEIERGRSRCTRLPLAFERFDLLRTAREGWNKLMFQTNAPTELLRLIPLSWTGRLDEVRPQLLDLLRSIAADCHRWLRHLDLIQRQAPGVLALAGQLLDVPDGDGDTPATAPPAPEVLSALVRDFLGQFGTIDYAACRSRFLDWCLREAIAPDAAAQAAAQLTGAWAAPGKTFAQAVAHDWPLRYVYRACQSFWA